MCLIKAVFQEHAMYRLKFWGCQNKETLGGKKYAFGKYPQLEPISQAAYVTKHAGILKMAQVLGSPVYICVYTQVSDHLVKCA